MRKLAPLVALLALAPDVACSSSSDPPPSGRARYAGPSLVTIGTADAKVTLHLDRFSLYDYRVEQQLKSLFNQLKWLYYRRGDRSLVFVTLPTGVRSFALPASPESTEISNPTC